MGTKRFVGLLFLFFVLSGSNGFTESFSADCGLIDLRVLESVVRVETEGSATAATSRKTDSERREWDMRIIDFSISGHGFIAAPYVLTVTHTTDPSRVSIQNGRFFNEARVVAVSSRMVTIQHVSSFLPSTVIHANHRDDLAIVEASSPLITMFSYPIAPTWEFFDKGYKRSLLKAGDCVSAILPNRSVSGKRRPGFRRVDGIVYHPFAVLEHNRQAFGRSEESVTIFMKISPGDSGSPVFAFTAGGGTKLVGLIAGASVDNSGLAYFARLDPIFPILEALKKVSLVSLSAPATQR